MKLLITSLLLSFSTNLMAIRFEIMNICKPEAFIQKDLELDGPDYLSTITIDFLNKNNIPFLGNETGIQTMLETPMGNQALEIISDTVMRSYGWCYEVDYKIPDVLMSEVFIKPKHTEHIRWFYGYAEYNAGTWINYCVPVFENPTPFICDKLYQNLD